MMNDKLHPSHKTKGSFSSHYDEICTLCGTVDKPGSWEKLAELCPSPTCIEVKAPLRRDLPLKYKKIFLGGSIEMGKAEHWQKRLVWEFFDKELVFLNPRRDDWDSTWIQDPTSGTQFHEQVSWEMDMQEDADLIVYYFDPATMSPITLLELGTYHRDKDVIVCCPPEYQRYGNVKILADRHNIRFVETYDELVKYLHYWLIIEIELLDVPMVENDISATTIGEYLLALLSQLWHDPEGFSGKRPFGNSGWYYDLYNALAKAKLIDTEYDAVYDEYSNYDKNEAEILINKAIKSLYTKK